MRTRHARARVAALLLLAGTAALAAPAPAGGAPAAGSGRPFLEALVPSVLARPGPLGILWWQWLALPVLLVLAVAAGALLGLVTRAILGRVAARARSGRGDLVVARVAGPLATLWAIAFLTAAHPWLELGGGAEAVLERILRAATYLALFWAAFRLVDVAFMAAGKAPWRGSAVLAGLLPLGRKISKVVLLALGVAAVLNELGFQVASLLAGLGIGGVALALAAQKTVENLFGSVSIGVDQPFRVGDFVKVEDFVGTVESIGMRSTRFRTLDRTIITIPNGKLADTRTETFAPRDRIRLYANLALSYHTSAEQMRKVLAGIEGALRGHPTLSKDAPSVRFTELKEWAMNVEVAAWFQTTDWNEFTAIRQDLLLRFVEIVEAAGTAFAFPVREVRWVDEPGVPTGKTKGPGETARAPRSGGADRDRTDDL
jgi:MscS family membrane protein